MQEMPNLQQVVICQTKPYQCCAGASEEVPGSRNIATQTRKMICRKCGKTRTEKVTGENNDLAYKPTLTGE